MFSFFGNPTTKIIEGLNEQFQTAVRGQGIQLHSSTVAFEGKTPIVTAEVDTPQDKERLIALVEQVKAARGVDGQVKITVRNPNARPQPAPTPQPKKEEPQPQVEIQEEEDKTYEAQKGDSFWAIAEKFYGDGTKYKILQEYNNSEHLRRGDIIKVPSLKSYINGEKLQALLTGLGYDTKGIDGKVGKNTETALKDFQTAVGLTADGQLNNDTKKALRSQFRQKVQNVDGKVLQILLRDAGHNPGKIDGITGRNTEKAISAFQQAQGLAVTGVADSTTITKLVQAYV